MRKDREWIVWAAAGILSVAVSRAQAPGESSAVISSDCDRACLIGFVRGYMDALVKKDPSRASLAKTVKFTENDVEMPIGNDGLWGSISGAATTGLEVADDTTGNAAWFGTVDEHGAAAYFALRIAVKDRHIVEAETVVDRNTGLPAPFGDPTKLVHDPAFGQVLSAGEQRPRERLIAVANGYFSTVELNDGQLFTEFDADCQRTENGVSTTSGSAGAAALAQGCEAQFKLGFYRINKRVRERRYPLVDVERGVVVGTGFFDHANTFDTYKTTDGKEHKTFLKWPNSLSLMEAFKIRDGKIYRVEAVFTYVPYFLHSPWNDAALPVLRIASSRVVGGACDRACLTGFANRYMDALVAKTPQDLPWAKSVRYSENNVPMMIGDALWGTISAHTAGLVTADPGSGNVAWFGGVEEHGAAAYYAMRLKIDNGLIAEVETVVDRKGNPGPFADPPGAAHDPEFEQPVDAAQRASRAALVSTVDGYYKTLQMNDGRLLTQFDPLCERIENGLSTTQGSYGPAAIAQGCEAQLKLGLFKADDRVRDRHYSVVDDERGVVVVSTLIDRASREDHVSATDGNSHPALEKYPHTVVQLEMFKVRNGKIDRIESISSFVPYFMRSAWYP